VIRLFVHGSCATPALLLLAGWFNNRLGVDPEKTLIWESGIWSNVVLMKVSPPSSTCKALLSRFGKIIKVE